MMCSPSWVGCPLVWAGERASQLCLDGGGSCAWDLYALLQLNRFFSKIVSLNDNRRIKYIKKKTSGLPLVFGVDNITYSPSTTESLS